MVATVFELRSSAVAVSYYEKDGYYAKNDPEHRQASFWHGSAAQDLGLKAHVRPSQFEDVLSGWVPGTEIRLGRMREGEHDHRPGWDITFSAPKSVSLEGLVVGDRRVIRAHDDAVRATLDWVEAELLETRGWDPATRRRPRVKADGMVVAGFRHLTSRDQDPQLHTHCVLANMTRTASGEWRSVEPTKIRRSEKLIGAYYRNELARRLQALGMAVTPRMVGRVPGFELAGYDRSFLDAFSGRRREILAYIEKHDLAYYAGERAEGGAAHAQAQGGCGRRGAGSGVARTRAVARAFPGQGCADAAPADRPGEPRACAGAPCSPARPAGERAPEPEARAGVAEAAARGGGVLGRAHASRRPAGRAVAGAGGGGAGGGGPGGCPCRRAPDGGPGGGDPGGGAGPCARAVHAGRHRHGDRADGEGRRADRGGAEGHGPRLRHRAGAAHRAPRAGVHARRARRGQGARGGRYGRGTAVGEPADAGPEGGGAHGAAVGRRDDRRAGPCRQRQDDDAARGEGASREDPDTGPRAVGFRRAGAATRGRRCVAHAAILPRPLRRPVGRRPPRPGAGRVRGLGSGGRRGLDDRHRPHGVAAPDRRASRGGPRRPGRRHGAAPGGGCGPALPAVAEGGDGDGDHGPGAAPARPGAAGRRRPCARGRTGRGDRGARRAGVGGAPRGARRRGGAALARAGAGGAGRYPDPRADPCDPPPGQRGGARGSGRRGCPARPGAGDRPAGRPQADPGAGLGDRELRAGRHGGVPPRRVRLPRERHLRGDRPRRRQGGPGPSGRRGAPVPAVRQRGALSRALRHRADRASGRATGSAGPATASRPGLASGIPDRPSC